MASLLATSSLAAQEEENRQLGVRQAALPICALGKVEDNSPRLPVSLICREEVGGAIASILTPSGDPQAS